MSDEVRQKQRLNLVLVWLTPSFGAFFTITDKSVLVSKDNKKRKRTKCCKYQVTTTLKMSIGYLQIFRVTSNENRHKMC